MSNRNAKTAPWWWYVAAVVLANLGRQQVMPDTVGWGADAGATAAVSAVVLAAVHLGWNVAVGRSRADRPR